MGNHTTQPNLQKYPALPSESVINESTHELVNTLNRNK